MNITDKKVSRRNLWKKREQEGYCIYCGNNTPKENYKGCKECLEKKVQSNKSIKDYNGKQSQYRLLIKYDVIKKYGNICACCGEDEIMFLSIDHINNDGVLDRDSFKNYSTFSFYLKLKKEPIREDLQVLCFNCNLGKQLNNGECPHKNKNKNLLPIIDNRRISKFNNGTKIDWPEDEDLIKMCNETSVSNVSKKLGVDFSSISNRLKRRGKYNLVKKLTGKNK